MKFNNISKILIILAIVLISSCVQQEKTITNQCIEELNVLKDIFGVNREDVKILSSECSTCSPWYQPVVAKFNATLIDSVTKKYSIHYSGSCTRRGAIQINYNIKSNEKTDLYEKMKEKICTDFNDWIIYLYDCQDETNIDGFISCINNYSYYIKSGIINITEDWDYCSTEGWKHCNEWNSCDPTGPSLISICTPEYCKMSCLQVYSDRRIQKHFTELCKNWEKVEEGKFIFSFDIPGDIREIISLNYLK